MPIEREEHLTLQKYLTITRDADFLALAWKEEAECTHLVTHYPSQFKAMDWFPTDTGYVSPKVKQVCEVCPVRLECLSFAVLTDEPSGVWGGKHIKAINSIRRKVNNALRRNRE